jgi:putative membrane protein
MPCIFATNCSDAVAMTVSEPASGDERRLHPWSWLFVLITQLRHVVLPLFVLLVFNRGEWWELLAVVGALALALYSLVYSFGFRYRLAGDELVLREGILDRTERHIPYARVQNIVLKRNPLHRLFGVAELRLESAGGAKPEAVMAVITLDAAREVERLLRDRGAVEGGDEPATAGAPAPLLRLPASEILRLGLASNRGWALVGAGFAAIWQFAPEERGIWRQCWRLVESAIGAGAAMIPGPLASALSALAFGLVFVLVLKLLSIAMAFVSFHGFMLDRRGERVRTEAGLLTRNAASARRDKIQRLIYGEGWLLRLLGRRTLECEVAGGAVAVNEESGARLRWLAPVATPDTAERIADDIAPGLLPSRMDWQPLHPRAWRRMFNASAFWWSVLALPMLGIFGPSVLLLWIGLLGWSLFCARRDARFAGWAFDGETFAVRGGWPSRQWTLARVGRGQSVRLESTPLDRRAGMATVAMDTAGARPGAFALRVAYIAETDARALHARLARHLDAPATSDGDPSAANDDPPGSH